MINKIYDIVKLAKDLELDYTDITDLYVSYIDEINSHCHNIKEYFYKNNFVELKMEIHNVKGVAANLLLFDVFEETVLLENLLNHGDFVGSKNHVENLINILINSNDKVIQSFSQVNVIL